jgi:hypothetical protein
MNNIFQLMDEEGSIVISIVKIMGQVFKKFKNVSGYSLKWDSIIWYDIGIQRRGAE